MWVNIILSYNVLYGLFVSNSGLEILKYDIKELNEYSNNDDKDGNDTDHCNHKPNNANNTISRDGKSLIIDLGCETPIATLDILWRNAEMINYNYTIQIASKNKSLVKEFNYASDLLPQNFSQTSGTENTAGRYLKLIINEPIEKGIHDSIDYLVVNMVKKKELVGESDDALWNNKSALYPPTIEIRDSDNVSSRANLYRIVDGDDLDVTNPNFSFSDTSIVNLKNGKPFSITVHLKHVEGLDVQFSSVEPTSTVIKSLNDASNMVDKPDEQTFYFSPYVTDPSNKTVYEHENLMIMLATSSETSVYYKTLANVLYD
jgi:hypothetical protein